MQILVYHNSTRYSFQMIFIVLWGPKATNPISYHRTYHHAVEVQFQLTITPQMLLVEFKSELFLISLFVLL